ncbi:hypothetical protein BDK51DRAFT_28209, partial [Blyttiomyces helicus]
AIRSKQKEVPCIANVTVYPEFPQDFVNHKTEARNPLTWLRRKQLPSTGWMPVFAPNVEDIFFLWMLLTTVKGLRSHLYDNYIWDNTTKEVPESSVLGEGPLDLKGLFERYLNDDVADFDNHIGPLWNGERPPRSQMKDLAIDSLERILIRNNNSLEEFRFLVFRWMAKDTTPLAVGEYDLHYRQPEQFRKTIKDKEIFLMFLIRESRIRSVFLFKLIPAATRVQGWYILASSFSGLFPSLPPGG